MRPRIIEHADRLLDQIVEGPNPTDLMHTYAFPLALQMACEVMAVPVEQRRTIVPDVQNQVDWTQQSAIVGASTHRLLTFADEVIAAKRTHTDGADDPIIALIRAHARDEISADELRGTVMYLFLTSAEPVTGPTGLAVYTLLRHPAVLRSVLEHDTDEKWDEAVREILRYHHNSMTSLPRKAVEDVEIAGVLIRKGDSVITPWIAATWDPDHYKAPEKFRLGRARTEHPEVTFGTGPHFCLGFNIARMHLAVALRTLWTRLPDLTLAVKHADVAWEPPEFLLTRPVELPITW
ncbi:cytochrome P450 [Nocardia brasiliensis]